MNAKGIDLGELLLSNEEEASMFDSASGRPKRQTFNHAPVRGVLEHPGVVPQLCSLCRFGETDKTESGRDVTCLFVLFDASAIVKTFSACLTAHVLNSLDLQAISTDYWFVIGPHSD